MLRGDEAEAAFVTKEIKLEVDSEHAMRKSV